MKRWFSGLVAIAAAMLTAVLGLQPALAAPGEGPGAGWSLGEYGHAGSYRLSVGDAYCADVNASLPAPVTGWIAGAPTPGERKQVGIKGATGRAGLTGPVVTDAEWAYLAAVLDAAKAHGAEPVWAAAADHLVRKTLAGDQAQIDYERWRYDALVKAHPEVPGVVAQLDKAAKELTSLKLELTWEQAPAAAADGVARVRLVNGAGAAVSREVTVRSGQTSLPVVDGKVTVPGGRAGTVALTASVSVPAAQPLMYRPAQYENAGSPDHKGQRMLQAAAPRALTAELTAEVAPISPKISTTTSQQTAKPGAAITDKVVITDADGYHATGQAILWGPYKEQPTAQDCRPGDKQAGSVPITINGNGTVTTAPVTVAEAGYYVWQEVLPATPNAPAVTTPCGVAEETTHVPAPPTVTPMPSTVTPAPSTVTPAPSSPVPSTPVAPQSVATGSPAATAPAPAAVADQPIIRAGGGVGPAPFLAAGGVVACVGAAAGSLTIWRRR